MSLGDTGGALWSQRLRDIQPMESIENIQVIEITTQLSIVAAS
jgi:hypothetical protein